MIDWHSHVLPKMDDGSSSVEVSLKLILMQQNQGVSKIIATPHFLANDESVDGLAAFREIRKMAENGQLPDLTLDEINEEIKLSRTNKP